MNTPYNNKPNITPKDVSNGYVKRYFLKFLSNGKIIEIDKVQHNKFRKNYLYELLEINWIISGYLNDSVDASGQKKLGAISQNQLIIDYYNQKMPGLDRLLRNSAEFFVGKVN